MDDRLRVCPRCGLTTARLCRMDNYLSLFFIPLIPLGRGEEFLECRRCGVVNPAAPGPGPRSRPARCPSCQRPVEPSHNFCPACGQRL